MNKPQHLSSRGSWCCQLWWYSSSIKPRNFLLLDKSQKHNFAPIPACHWEIDLPFEGLSHLICKNWASVLISERFLISDKIHEIA